jgi:serine/threonine-protein kinase ULK/ATG1
MKRVGDYVLVSELGKGQFGIVYKAKHVNTGDVYAIKTVKKASISSNPKLKSLFDTEINIMSKIKHPNILHLYEYLETGNNFYLIIDYCNNGDMESHVKKFNFLGEDESVYFLMQIMNGFRELHKHKIMHRDFKLANIFLHDDKLIVGDFGFAKSGHEMAQTKLGSPITMAPEMLLAQNTKNLVYTNKADLWSIGVCFYQMIFGQLPWEVSDLDDLKQKVQTDSGKNLQFPIDKCPITQECKDLLISLLEVDPVKRIEWDNFFNHKVFAIHEQKKQQKENALKMRTSVMFRNNEENVKKLFEQNKKDNTDTVELAQEPEDIKLGPQSAQALKECG